MTLRVRYLGTTLALVAAGLIYIATQTAQRPGPVVSPPSVAGRVASKPAPLPTAAEVLALGERLGLTPAQGRRLEALAAEWQRDAGGPEAEAREAAEEFGRFMREAQAAGRTSVDEIRQRSERVQQRSAALRELRQLHSARALATLDERQRARLDEMRPMTGGRR